MRYPCHRCPPCCCCHPCHFPPRCCHHNQRWCLDLLNVLSKIPELRNFFHHCCPCCCRPPCCCHHHWGQCPRCSCVLAKTPGLYLVLELVMFVVVIVVVLLIINADTLDNLAKTPGLYPFPELRYISTSLSLVSSLLRHCPHLVPELRYPCYHCYPCYCPPPRCHHHQCQYPWCTCENSRSLFSPRDEIPLSSSLSLLLSLSLSSSLSSLLPSSSSSRLMPLISMTFSRKPQYSI